MTYKVQAESVEDDVIVEADGFSIQGDSTAIFYEDSNILSEAPTRTALHAFRNWNGIIKIEDKE